VRAADVIRELNLAPHPEGGHYREIYRDAVPDGGRGAVTSIHYLLSGGERSHWHRVTDAAEIWNFHAAGGAGTAGLELALSPDGGAVETHVLGSNLTGGHKPQVVVPAGWWQAARLIDPTAEGWVLVGCAVAPAFEFSAFEMAPPNWAPADWKS